MPFSIQTNVNSLIAQENLRVNSNFQSQTIQRLTSGYRINQSGDDAAGLAIANKFRSDTAELTQGVRNANDGISTLQIIDGGMNNIGKMLDRLKTLATQSSSETFTGDRTVLNKEYQTLVNEIDRQAQGIGLSTGGRFAQSMGVYVGGGTTAGGNADTGNGTITLDLSNSVVDTKALGLRTSQFTVQSAAGTSLAAASSTSVGNIVSVNGDTATFELSGPNFSNTIISVTLSTSDTTRTLSDKLNNAIQAAGNAGTPAAGSLRNANIQVKAVTDGSGAEQLAFTSATSAFQVTAGTNTANALLGKFDSMASNAATGASVMQTVTAGSAAINASAVEAIALKVTVDGVVHDLTVSIDGTETLAAGTLLGKVTAALNAGNVTDVTASIVSGKLEFKGTGNQSVEVQAAGDTNNVLGLGSWQEGSQVVGNTKIKTGTAVSGLTVTVQVGNNTAQTLGLDVLAADNLNNILTSLTTANGSGVAGNTAAYAALKAQGVTATIQEGKLAFVGTSGQAIQITAISSDGNNTLGLGASGTRAVTATTEILSPASKAIAGTDVIANSAIAVPVADVAAGDHYSLQVTVDGVAHDLTDIVFNGTGNASPGDAAGVLAGITGNSGYSALTALGVRAVLAGSADTLKFVGDNGQAITVTGATNAAFGFGTTGSLTSTTSANAGTGSSASAGVLGDKATVAFSINGGDKIQVSFTSTGVLSTTADALQAAINGNAELQAAGLTVSQTTLAISAQGATTTGVKFRAYVESQSGSLQLGLGTATASAASFSGTDKASMLASAGASQTGLGTNNDVFAFAGLKNAGGYNGSAGSLADQQVLSFSANDANGTLQSTSVTLTSTNAYDVDKAVESINIELQKSTNPTMKNVIAVKETNAAGTAEGIRFISSLNNFSVNVGQAANNSVGTPVGLYDGTAGATSTQGKSVTSSASGAIDISSSAGAKQAVIVLGSAVQKLGSAQAAIGKGQNQLGYAINLANSQISNFSSAQAQIRDADVASEAANLSKAQVLQQASIAAMAQANSAPQAVLSLLKG